MYRIHVIIHVMECDIGTECEIGPIVVKKTGGD